MLSCMTIGENQTHTLTWDAGTVACKDCGALDYPGPGHECEPLEPPAPIGWDVDAFFTPPAEYGRPAVKTEW